MLNNWYYTHDVDKIGPFSDHQLRDLADAGEILRTDTIWKQGVEKGVEARRVKNLFPPAKEVAAPEATGPPTTKVDHATPGSPTSDISDPISSSEASPTIPADTQSPKVLIDKLEPVTTESKPSSTYKPSPRPPQAQRTRAVAGKGAIIVGQDGTNAKIKKKCTECGYEDSCWHTIQIRKGINKSSFFCRNCSRTRHVEFRGFVH